MSSAPTDCVPAASQPAADPPVSRVRKRPRPGERRVQILQMLASMLEQPHGERITTASLAARLSVSEAALYRHFASKAQMFEGLIEFIEHTVFGLINQIALHEEHGLRQTQAIVHMLLSFADKNPGMTRVLLGDALTGEDARLSERMTQCVDRIEASLKQSLRMAVTQGAWPADADIASRANLMLCVVLGRWHRYARSGFGKSPLDGADAQLQVLLA